MLQRFCAFGKNAAIKVALHVMTRDCFSDEDDDNDEFDDILHTPKKRKLTTTSKYIYDNLFLQGKDSDVTVTVTSPEFHAGMAATNSISFCFLFCKKNIELPERQINDPSSWKYFSLPFLPATPLSAS